jgi:hypothetical protein
MNILLWLGIYVGLAALALAAAPVRASAASDCSGTVGTTAQPLFSGMPPTRHFEVTNPSQNANSICVSPFGTASCGAAGTVTIAPGGDKWWDFPDLPGAPTIIASGPSTPYQCDYQ